ncbi:MAG TPA: methylmalonyl Co-A mutase-associated GTPase MeaB [Acidimicrobiales bacterium]|nr:methylmalonyl Co-A mutase-associated GTPase MeaB [Acidimicrobiales bacterium]
MAIPRLPTEPAALVDAVAAGDRRALARMLSIVERGDAEAREIGRLIFSRAGAAATLGITGAPGAGKSTLTSALVAHMRGLDVRPAVLAVDPSSPFSGGAILGDRVRMAEHALDTEVFIRSMATRGHLGGLTLAVPEAIRVLDAAGFDWVIVETVGVGQVEVEIVSQADSTVVVVNPGWGDAVQANKAGLMEIADVFVINKADRDGVRQTRHDLKAMLQMGDSRDWTPPIVEAVATEGQGAAELWEAIGEHQAHVRATGELDVRRSRRLRDELESVVTERLRQRAAALTGGDGARDLIERVSSGEIDPYAAADDLLGPLGA